MTHLIVQQHVLEGHCRVWTRSSATKVQHAVVFLNQSGAMPCTWRRGFAELDNNFLLTTTWCIDAASNVYITRVIVAIWFYYVRNPGQRYLRPVPLERNFGVITALPPHASGR